MPQILAAQQCLSGRLLRMQDFFVLFVFSAKYLAICDIYANYLTDI